MDEKNDPTKIQASPLSQLAIRFKNSNNSRERDKLLLEISEHYMPKIGTYINTIPKHDREEIIQIYRIEVFHALTIWKMKSNFETYLYPYIKGVLRRYMDTAKMFKKVRDIDADGNVVYRHLDYCSFADMADYGEELTYEMLDEFYDNEENEDENDTRD